MGTILQLRNNKRYLSFDGADNWADISDASATGDPLTAEIWIRSTNTTRQNYLGRGSDSENPLLRPFEFGTDGNNTIVHNIETGDGYGWIYVLATQINPLDGAWHHIVHAAGSGVLRIYIDGQLQIMITDYMDPEDKIWMNPPRSSIYEGDIKEIRFWDRALSQQEIIHYSGGVGGSEPGLVNCWLLNEGFEAVLYDISSETGHGGIISATRNEEEGRTNLLLSKELYEGHPLSYNISNEGDFECVDFEESVTATDFMLKDGHIVIPGELVEGVVFNG